MQALVQRHETDAAQMRGEVRHLAADGEDLVVQRRNEFRHRVALVRRDLLEHGPEYLLQPDARALTVKPDRMSLEGITFRRLCREEMAHHVLPLPYAFFSSVARLPASYSHRGANAT